MAEKICCAALGVLSVALSFVGYYFYVRAKIERAAAGAVESAERDDLSGESKLKDAVSQIAALVPAALKPIISERTVERIVQTAFDKIEAYAQKQSKKN